MTKYEISSFAGQSENLLNKPRVMYGHKILTWDYNSKKDYVMRGATASAKGKKIAAYAWI